MRVLVTGGAGFVGSWFVRALLAPNSPYAASKAGGDLIARVRGDVRAGCTSRSRGAPTTSGRTTTPRS